MSYPPPQYFGNGEATARYRPVDTPPELPRPGGAASFLATGASTGGKFGLYRWDMGPEPAGADAHFHRTFTESFFVLSGSGPALRRARGGSTPTRVTSTSCPRAVCTASATSPARRRRC